MAPTVDWTDMSSGDHFVHFYESDDHLIEQLVAYFIHGLRSNEAVICIATPAHIDAVSALAGAVEPKFREAVQSGRFTALDAEETLAMFSVDGQPDRGLFNDTMGGLVRQTAASGYRVRAFGEMVGILCRDGMFEQAVTLERYWDELSKSINFSLYCGYPFDCFARPGAHRYMDQICTRHSCVIPGESYNHITNINERLRAIALLQQKNLELAAEVAELRRRIGLQSTAAELSLA